MGKKIDSSKQRKFGVLLEYINLATKMIVQFLYVPIMLGFLGQREYGVYQLVASIISYLSLLNFGFGGAYLRFYVKCKDNKEKESVLNGTYLGIFSFFSLIVLCIGLIISANAKAILGSELTVDEIELAKKLFFVLAINMSLTFPISVFSSIITSREAFVFQKLIEIFKNILSPFLIILLLMLGKGSVGMVCATTFITVGGGIANIWYVFCRIRAPFRFGKIDFGLLREIGVFSFFIFLNSIIDQINWNVDKFILVRISGAISVAIYSVGAQINTIFIQLSDMTASIMATKVNLIVANEKSPMIELNKLFVKIGRIQAFIIFAVVAGFGALGKEFIKLWAGTEYYESYYVALLLIVSAALPLTQSLGVDIQRAVNKHQIRSVVYAILSLLNLIISIPLSYRYGAMGAAMGTFVSLIFGNGLLMNLIYQKYIGLNVIVFWKKVMPIILVSVIPYIIVSMLNHVFYNISWLDLILKGVIFVAIYFVAEYCISMNSEEKKLIRGLYKVK